MNKEILKVGFSWIYGIAAGYFVHRALNGKAEELIIDGGIANAGAIGFGHGAITTGVGLMTAGAIYAALK